MGSSKDWGIRMEDLVIRPLEDIYQHKTHPPYTSIYDAVQLRKALNGDSCNRHAAKRKTRRKSARTARRHNRRSK